VFADELVVDQPVIADIQSDVLEDGRFQPQRAESICSSVEQAGVEIGDVRCVLDDAQVPIRLESAQLWRAKETHRPAFRERLTFRLAFDRKLEDLADGREIVMRVALPTPSRDSLSEDLVQFRHGTDVTSRGDPRR